MAKLLRGKELGLVHHTFVAKMEGIYAGFSNERTIELIPQPIMKGFSAYLIALQLPEAERTKIASWAEQIAQTAPGLRPYLQHVLHITISDYMAQNKVADPNTQTFQQLVGIVQEVMAMRSVRPPRIRFGEWLYKQDGIIVSGYPTSQSFVQIAHTIVSTAAEQGIRLRLPWGAHITTARPAESTDVLGQLHSIMQSGEAPILGAVYPEYIVVAHATINESGWFRFTIDPKPQRLHF